MEISLSCLSSFSKKIENQKIFKKKFPKIPKNYGSPNHNKKFLESYFYLNKEENINSGQHEKYLLDEFIKKLSRTDNQIKKECQDYINKIKYYPRENENTIKLKKLYRLERVLINKKLDNLLDLRKYKLKYEKYRKQIKNNNNNNSFNSKNNEQKIFKQRITRNKNIDLNLFNKNAKSISTKNINNKKFSIFNQKTPKIKNFINDSVKNSSSSFLSFNKKLSNGKENNRINKKLILKESKGNKTSYKKKWNLPKSLNFNKYSGRNVKKINKVKIYEEIRDYNPKYDYIFPNSKKNLFCFNKSEVFSFNKLKINSIRKALYNYNRQNFSFDNKYKIMDIINSEKEKKNKSKNEKSENNVGEMLNEYIKYHEQRN